MRALLASILIALANPASAGPCAVHPLTPHSATVNGTVIPPGGGVLIALGGSLDWSSTAQPDLTKTTWKFVDAGKQHAPVIRVIAPGLAVYEPPSGTTSIKLVGDKQALIADVKRTTVAVAELPAPQVKSIEHTRYVSSSPRRGDRSSVNVMLAGDRPDTAVTMVLFVAGKGVAWTNAFAYQGPRGALEIYHSPDRCEPQIPGLVETTPGTRVSVAWVDANGQIGARSKEFTVAKGKP